MRHLVILAAGLSLLGCKPGEHVRLVTPTPVPALDGGVFYSRNCATCHMEDGSGVPMLQPALLESKVVMGDPAKLIRVILEGPAKVLDPDREKFSNTMPPFPQLKDAEIAAILTHVRKTFGHDAPPVSTEEVAALRAAKP